MRVVIGNYVKFLTGKEKITYIALLTGRSLSGLLDVLGVLLIGLLGASIAAFVSDGSNTGKSLSFVNMQIPAVTAKTLPLLMVLLVIIFVSKSLFAIAMTKVMAIKVAEIEARAARQISKNVLGHSLENMRSVTKDELVFAVQIGTPAAFTGLMNSFASLVSEGFLFVILSAAFIIFNPIATLIMLAYFIILAYLINVFVGKKLTSASQTAYKKTLEANSALGDLTSAFRELSVSGKREQLFQKIFSFRRAASRSIGEQTYLSGMPRHIIETGLIVGLGFFILSQSFSSDIAQSASTIGVFLAGGFRIVAAMLPWQNALVNIKLSIPQALPAWDLLSSIPSSNESARYLFATAQVTQSVKNEPMKVELKNVHYSYGNKEQSSVDGVSFVVEAGQHAAIIGDSGAGKSTLADLILGLSTPKQGQVLLNGTPAFQKISLTPGCASYVPQSPGMVAGSLRRNISLGFEDSDIDDRKLTRAIAGSRLQPLVDSLDDGLETNLGLHSETLSGGQIQKVGLARALYNEPGLILLDEATSALDAESESDIVKSLQELKGKITVITIAHRLNSIKMADIVFLMDQGKIVASGTLKDLIRENPKVAKAVELLKAD